MENDGCLWEVEVEVTSGLHVMLGSKHVKSNWILLFSCSSRRDWREFQTFLQVMSNPLRIRSVNLKSLEKFVAANKTQGSNFQQDLFAAKRLRQEPGQKGTCSLHLWLPNNAAVSNSPKADIHGVLRRTRPQWKLGDFSGFPGIPLVVRIRVRQWAIGCTRGHFETGSFKATTLLGVAPKGTTRHGTKHHDNLKIYHFWGNLE